MRPPGTHDGPVVPRVGKVSTSLSIAGVVAGLLLMAAGIVRLTLVAEPVNVDTFRPIYAVGWLLGAACGLMFGWSLKSADRTADTSDANVKGPGRNTNHD